MNNLKRVLSVALGGIILVGTTSFASTGIVNAPNGLVLRETASKSANPVLTVSDDSEVEIIEKDGEWYKVKYNSYEGYLFAEYVEVEEEPETEIAGVEEAKQEESTEEQAEEKETSEVENSENTEKQYPQNLNVKSDLTIYSIPSVTAKTIATVNKDTEITINYELNNWVNITYGNTTGWARKYFINNETTTVEEEPENTESEITEEPKVEQEKTENTVTPIDNKKGYIDVSSSANIREKASTDSSIINTLLRNTEVTIIAEEGDFYKIKYQDITGYIAKSLISEKPVAEVTSRGSSERKEEVLEVTESKEVEENKSSDEQKTNEETTTSSSSEGNDIASYAKKYIGYNYVSGGTTPSNGFDCSGFAYYVVNACGYSLSRSCQVQAQSGTAVSRENLAPGDLIFFCNGANGSIGHVGIYIGGGQIVHASNARDGIKVSPYKYRTPVRARRVIN